MCMIASNYSTRHAYLNSCVQWQTFYNNNRRTPNRRSSRSRRLSNSDSAKWTRRKRPSKKQPKLNENVEKVARSCGPLERFRALSILHINISILLATHNETSCS